MSDGVSSQHRVAVSDVSALKTLAHPLRLRLLHYLLAAGPSTASQCADALDDTGSNCSYHLRHLARFGLVERAERTGAADQRERPWRAAATGFDFLPEIEDPRAAAVRSTLSSLRLDEVVSSLERYYALEGKLPQDWRQAAAFENYVLMVTPDELSHLVMTLDAVIRPYIRTGRSRVRGSARPVNLSLQAHPTPEFI